MEIEIGPRRPDPADIFHRATRDHISAIALRTGRSVAGIYKVTNPHHSIYALLWAIILSLNAINPERAREIGCDFILRFLAMERAGSPGSGTVQLRAVETTYSLQLRPQQTDPARAHSTG
jgi:hypothetical protein